MIFKNYRMSIAWRFGGVMGTFLWKYRCNLWLYKV